MTSDILKHIIRKLMTDENLKVDSLSVALRCEKKSYYILCITEPKEILTVLYWCG